MISRRTFIKKGSHAAAASMMAPALISCTWSTPLTGGIKTPNFKLGHTLRERKSSQPTEFQQNDVVIVGGGVAGLSAARWLSKNHVDLKLLELENTVGGNSRGDKNAVSAYPLGAHYLPLPNVNNRHLIEFLQEVGLITGYQNGLPIYAEEHLCFDPKERLFINHHWQEGLIPHEGIPKVDRDQIQRFLTDMHELRLAKGADGRFAFDLPVDESSRDPEYLKWDGITMAEYLIESGFTSTYLLWYINYCCLDDYGSTIHDTSAWAGFHYFASRKGVADNAESDDVLTWPEGNFWLVKALTTMAQQKVQSEVLVMSVRPEGNHVLVDWFDAVRNTVVQTKAKAVVMATPQFVNQYLIQAERTFEVKNFQYAPWLVANLTVTGSLDEKRGEPLCWDNVIYGRDSLGYVHAGHQQLAMPKEKTVITYYRPLTANNPVDIRKQMQETTWETWSQSVFNDLGVAHPNLQKETETLDVFLWGHGMIKPGPGFIWGGSRSLAAQSIGNKIFFAHSDLGGVSLFEEAFAQGIRAAQAVMQEA
jgi:hypothetical protein